LNYVQRLRWSGETVEAVGASLSWSAWQRARFHLSLNKRLDNDREWRAAFSVHIPLGNGVSSSARVERNSEGTTTSTVTAQRNPPAGPGLGWNIEASQHDSSQARAGLQYNTSNAELSADASTRRGGDWALRLGGRGSVGWLAGVPFASRPVGQGSFAVVEVGGVPGVPVKRSNQVVAYTNADGKAFIPRLVPWLDNQIEIDPIDLPLNVEVHETTKPVTPYPRSGALVKFDLRRTRQALLTLVQPDGEAVPAGARVRLLPDGPEFLTGRRGKVWLTDLSSARQQIQVRWNGSHGCLLILDVPESKDGSPGLLGPLTCTSPKP
jgi:outer membrane usher protein